MLDARADDDLIYRHGLTGLAAVKSYLGSIGRRDNQPGDPDAMRGNLDAIADCWQARPLGKKTTLQGAIARMLDPQWWARNLRRQMLKENEANERASGNIRRKKQCYVSDFGLKRTRERAKKNRETLARLEVTNEDGESLNLLEVADKSVSNPKLRRAELMTRARGFEEYAAIMGHAAFFLTLTSPSRFHKFSGDGKDNRKWKGETTKDCQAYLCKVWAKTRAAWKRAGLVCYGFRVAEPHHDGSVHWHILLFAEREQVGWFAADRFAAGRADSGAGLVGIAGRYALQDAPKEYGAKKRRFTCKMLDKKNGSAAGYISKYICKNIDGLQENGAGMGLDRDSGTNALKAAERVRAWAGIAGIRQFAQIGGPSVTVWRELRRIKDADAPLQLQLFEGARLAADEGNWAAFWSVQGGIVCAENRLRPEYSADSTGKYGDAVQRVFGVSCHNGPVIRTRLHQWKVQRAGRGEVDRADNQQRAIFKKYGRAMALALLAPPNFDPAFEGASRPWTSGNNCTENEEKAALALDYLRGQESNSGGGRETDLPESYFYGKNTDCPGGARSNGPANWTD